MSNGSSDGWNFRVLLGQGTSWEIAEQVASPRLVLPFLYIAVGAPTMFAGLLLPIVQIGKLISEIAVAPLISASSIRKWYSALGILVMAAALAVIALSARDMETEWLAVLFLVVAVAIGVAKGIINIAYQDLIGRVLPTPRRSTLYYTVSAIAGVLAIAIAWIGPQAIGTDQPLTSHLTFVWAGVAVCIVAGTLMVLVREPADTSKRQGRVRSRVKGGTLAQFAVELRHGIKATGRLPWFRRFLVARLLFLSIELAMPFYAIHAAGMHKGTHTSLGVFVIASSLGVIIGGPIWRLLDRWRTRAVMALASAIAAVGGLISLLVAEGSDLGPIASHGAVFFLVSLAAQGVINSRSLYLVQLAPGGQRPYLIAVGQTLTGAVGILASFALGAVAHYQHVAWPIACIVALNIAAALYVLTLAPSRERPSQATA